MQADETSTIKEDKYEEKLRQRIAKLVEVGLDLSQDIFDISEEPHDTGAYGAIFTGNSRRHNIVVAEKRFISNINGTNKSKIAKSLLLEMSVWSRLQHDNLLPFLGYVMRSGRPALISPWIQRGSVRKVMEGNPTKPMAHLAKGIASGLLYLHEQDVVHADLKCESGTNLMLTQDNILLSDFEDRPLIADFGISQYLQSFTFTIAKTAGTGTKGTVRWMAREFFTFDPNNPEGVPIGEYCKETDVWAFGMVLYELLSHLIPYSNVKNDMQVSCMLMVGRTPCRPTDSVCDQKDQDLLWSICEECWKEIPSSRPGMKALYDKLNGSGDQPE